MSISSSQEFRFSCSGCGKCCNSPPAMGTQEAMRLAENFFLVNYIMAYEVNSTEPLNPTFTKKNMGDPSDFTT